MLSKMTRLQAAKTAAAACKVPQGLVSSRGQLRLPSEASKHFQSQSSTERGSTYALGQQMEADGYLFFYEILDRLGVRIISTIVGDSFTIVCRHKTYEGLDQSDLLLEIIRDRIENFNYLTLGGHDHEH